MGGPVFPENHLADVQTHLTALRERLSALEREVADLRAANRELAARKTEMAAARTAAEEKERQLRLMAEAINDVFWLSTPGIDKMIYASPGYERIWGRSRDSLYADPLSFLNAIHPDDAERIRRALPEHARGRWRHEYRIMAQTDSGLQVRWIFDRGYPIYDDKGQLVLLAGVASDISEQHETRERLQRTLLELQHAKDDMERLMLLDPLTATANRRYLDRYLDREWRREGRDARQISLMLADIDHFKAYNDYYGHLDGDDCLARVAHTLARDLHRPADLLVRYGGEEFLILLPETDANATKRLAEQLRTRIAALYIRHAKSPTAPFVTLSIGITTVDPRIISPRQAIALADQALYAAKNQGRNQAVFIQPGP